MIEILDERGWLKFFRNQSFVSAFEEPHVLLRLSLHVRNFVPYFLFFSGATTSPEWASTVTKGLRGTGGRAASTLEIWRVGKSQMSFFERNSGAEEKSSSAGALRRHA